MVKDPIRLSIELVIYDTCEVSSVRQHRWIQLHFWLVLKQIKIEVESSNGGSALKATADRVNYLLMDCHLLRCREIGLSISIFLLYWVIKARLLFFSSLHIRVVDHSCYGGRGTACENTT